LTPKEHFSVINNTYFQIELERPIREKVDVIDEGNGIREFPPIPDIARIIDNMDPPIGFGLFLIKQLADQVEFNQRTDGGHVVRMAIKISRKG